VRKIKPCAAEMNGRELYYRPQRENILKELQFQTLKVNLSAEIFDFNFSIEETAAGSQNKKNHPTRTCLG
jgi:hypothetical protein